MPYLLDSNIFVEAKNLYYGFDFCPAFWNWLDAEHAKGKIFSIEKVKDELLAGADDLSTLAAARSQFFLTPDALVLQSMGKVSNWASSGNYDPAAVSTFLQIADYYLVAHGLAYQHVVVTHEVPGQSAKRIKIPDACIALGVKVVSPYQMLRAEKARFVLGNGS